MLERAIEIGKEHNVSRDAFGSDLAFLTWLMDRLEGKRSFAEQMTYLVGLYQQMTEPVKRVWVEVWYNDGNKTSTWINTDYRGAIDYYLGHRFDVGLVEARTEEDMPQVVNVRLLSLNPT